MSNIIRIAKVQKKKLAAHWINGDPSIPEVGSRWWSRANANAVYLVLMIANKELKNLTVIIYEGPNCEISARELSVFKAMMVPIHEDKQFKPGVM